MSDLNAFARGSRGNQFFGSVAAIGSMIAGATVGSVLFVGSGPVIAEDNANFRYSDADNQLLLADGTFNRPGYAFIGEINTGFYRNGAGTIHVALTGSNAIQFGHSVTPYSIGLGADTFLQREGAGHIGQKNSTTPQAFSVFNTYTSGAIWERGGFLWSSNILKITTAAAGAGSNRDIEISFANGAEPCAHFTRIASSVNYIDIWGSAAGAGVRIQSTGSDANISFNYVAKGSGSHHFYTNGGGTLAEQVRIVPTASAVNYWQVSGSATGGTPYLLAAGSDTNIRLAFISKGTGALTFATNGAAANEQFRVNHVASAVNYITVIGSVTTGIPQVGVDGADTNITMKVSGKGTGSIQLGNSQGVGFVAGAPSASTVNYGYVNGRATGSAPTFGVEGNDTNIDLELSPKGTGVVRIAKAAVALGGGAAPTLGTIGGSGPATAAQNAWFQFKDSAGNNFWVPIWR